MNKNLEKEYKELMEENVPDLWARIEAGLESELKSGQESGPAGKKIIPWRKYGAWGMAAAACLCLIIMVPFLLPQITGGNLGTGPNDYSGGTSNAGAATTGGYEFADSATTWEDDFVGAAEAETAEGTGNEGYEYEGEKTENYTVRARLREVAEVAGRTVYIIQIEGDADTDFPEETLWILHGEAANGEGVNGESIYEEEPVEGEVYLFDFVACYDKYGLAECLLRDIRSE